MIGEGVRFNRLKNAIWHGIPIVFAAQQAGLRGIRVRGGAAEAWALGHQRMQSAACGNDLTGGTSELLQTDVVLIDPFCNFPTPAASKLPLSVALGAMEQGSFGYNHANHGRG